MALARQRACGVAEAHAQVAQCARRREPSSCIRGIGGTGSVYGICVGAFACTCACACVGAYTGAGVGIGVGACACVSVGVGACACRSDALERRAASLSWHSEQVVAARHRDERAARAQRGYAARERRRQVAARV